MLLLIRNRAALSVPAHGLLFFGLILHGSTCNMVILPRRRCVAMCVECMIAAVIPVDQYQWLLHRQFGSALANAA